MDASESPTAAPANPDDWAPRSALFMPPPATAPAPASSWSFLGLCSKPQVARDLELADVQQHGNKNWQRELDKMREYVAGVEGAVQGQMKVYHQQMQECVKRLEKRYVEEITTLRAHLLTGGADPEHGKTASAADAAGLAAERSALQASLAEVQELRGEVRALQSGNAVPRVQSDEPQDETKDFAEIEAFKQRMNAEIESAKQRATEQDGDSAKAVSEIRMKFLQAMEGRQTIRKPGVARIEFELERLRLKTAIEMQKGCLEAQSADIEDLKRKLTRMPAQPRTREDMKTEAQEDDKSTSMALLQKELAVVRAEVELLHRQSSALENDVCHMKEDLHIAIEASSIKAGYLAGALVGCGEAERKRITNVLKKREEELQIGPTEQALYTSKDATVRFEVEIDRRDGGNLGVRFDLSSGTDLEVVEFTGKRSSGLFHQYNVEVAPPQTPVAVGDRIVEVNGIRGYASLLARELENKKVLSMVLHR